MLIYLQLIETPEDTSKFCAIFEAYGDLMYAVAFRYLQNEQDAEDIVHDAFVKIAERIKIVLPPCPQTRRFVMIIVENRAKDVLRRRRRHPQLPLREQWIPAAEIAVEDAVLVPCIQKLTEKQQRVLWLKYDFGCDLHEVAKLLDISLYDAQKTDQRAKKKLAELLKAEGVDLDDHR